MFSYDDRLRAVQLYIKLGKRVGLTILQLGYPTKNALKAWHRAYEQHDGLPECYVRHPKYTQAQKDLAVDHFDSGGRCIAVTIKALGYPSRSLLASWIRKAHPELPPRVGHAHEALSSAAKQSAVMALCLRQGSAQTVAQELGVSRPPEFDTCGTQVLDSYRTELTSADYKLCLTRLAGAGRGRFSAAKRDFCAGTSSVRPLRVWPSAVCTVCC